MDLDVSIRLTHFLLWKKSIDSIQLNGVVPCIDLELSGYDNVNSIFHSDKFLQIMNVGRNGSQ